MINHLIPLADPDKPSINKASTRSVRANVCGTLVALVEVPLGQVTRDRDIYGVAASLDAVHMNLADNTCIRAGDMEVGDGGERESSLANGAEVKQSGNYGAISTTCVSRRTRSPYRRVRQ